MAFEERKIAIKDLMWWEENARIPENYYSREREEIIDDYLNKPHLKIRELIEEIISDSDLPQLEKIVVYNDDGNMVVYEGNRRLVSYKIIANPWFLEKLDGKLYKYLIDKQDSHSINNDYKLECIIGDSKDECYRYIDSIVYHYIFAPSR